jgi:hypothetical protein
MIQLQAKKKPSQQRKQKPKKIGLLGWGKICCKKSALA